MPSCYISSDSFGREKAAKNRESRTDLSLGEVSLFWRAVLMIFPRGLYHFLIAILNIPSMKS
jgi:hypothetical protein